MIKLVIFDLDGTLLNTIDDLAAAGNHVCAAHGWPTHTSEQFRYFVGDGVYKLIERLPALLKHQKQYNACVMSLMLITTAIAVI